MGQMVIGTTELKNKIEELRALNTQFKSAVSELEIELYAQKLEVILAKYVQGEQKNIEIANQRKYK